MAVTLVDSNVLIDLLTEDAQWSSWSARALEEAASRGRLAINPLIYAEVSVPFERIEDLDDVLVPDDFLRLPLPWEAGFLAGKSFLQYRQAGGARRSPLPDFYIGAHAAIAAIPLLTRDPRRYRRHFPRLELIAPKNP